jgi:NitT/TauT family transport system ATP-binding protein
VGGSALVAIDVRGVTRSFVVGRSRLIALEGLDLSVGDGEVVALVGPNGCGKSTLLRIISGLLVPDAGSVAIEGRQVTGIDPRVGLVFQEPRLLPWRDVLSNVALPLELAGVERPVREAAALRQLELLRVSSFSTWHPARLSGGMAQRVALARTLVLEPRVLLLDEPFSALDALTRDHLNAELLELWLRTGASVLLVTHSIPEAVLMADRVLVMSPRPGRIVADVTVDVPRAERSTTADATVFGAAAARVRAALGDGALVAA